MQENSLIKKNILKFIDYKGISKYKFYQETGITRGILDQNNGMSEENTAKFLAYYPNVNAEWLLTGKGSMLRAHTSLYKSDKPIAEIIAEMDPKIIEALTDSIVQNTQNQRKDTRKNDTPAFQTEEQKKLIPFYDDVNAVAGKMQLSDMSPVAEPNEWIDAGDWFRDADTAMRVHGDSMFPVYKSGCIVVMKEVKNKSLIIYGQDYVLETSEYRVIKRIQKASEKGFWLACSVNDEVWEKGDLAGRLIHEPFEVAIDNVNRIFRVLGCVCRNESSRIVYAKK